MNVNSVRGEGGRLTEVEEEAATLLRIDGEGTVTVFAPSWMSKISNRSVTLVLIHLVGALCPP